MCHSNELQHYVDYSSIIWLFRIEKRQKNWAWKHRRQEQQQQDPLSSVKYKELSKIGRVFYLWPKVLRWEREQMHPVHSNSDIIVLRASGTLPNYTLDANSIRIVASAASGDGGGRWSRAQRRRSMRYLIDRPKRSRRLILRGRFARFDAKIAGWRCHKGTGFVLVWPRVFSLTSGKSWSVE